MKENSKGIFHQINVEDLGEFRFLFHEKKLEEHSGKDKHYVEAYWCPENYGLVNFIVGYYADDINEELKRIDNNMDYFIDGARISCICRIEDGSDDEGVYESILNLYFDEECETEVD